MCPRVQASLNTVRRQGPVLARKVVPGSRCEAKELTFNDWHEEKEIVRSRRRKGDSIALHRFKVSRLKHNTCAYSGPSSREDGEQSRNEKSQGNMAPARHRNGQANERPPGLYSKAEPERGRADTVRKSLQYQCIPCRNAKSNERETQTPMAK